MQWSKCASKSALSSTANTMPRPTYPPQVVEFTEPSTNVRVVLIGTMHYNPRSIQTVEEALNYLGEDDALGSVVIESCEVRWNKTAELLASPRGRILESVLTNEMRAASNVAAQYGRPVVLGDQRIDVTGTSLKGVVRRIAVDLATPLGGGWGRFFREFREAADAALPLEAEGRYLDVTSILDPRLLLFVPVCFVKYPLSFLVRNPLTTTLIFLTFGGLAFFSNLMGGGEELTFSQLSTSDLLPSLLFSGLEYVVFGRILVQVLLAERNEIIARNILDQCRTYSDNMNTDKKSVLPFLDAFSFLWKDEAKELNINTAYVQSNGNDVRNFSSDSKEKTVVAVLGMAHCNGIVNLMTEGLLD